MDLCAQNIIFNDIVSDNKLSLETPLKTILTNLLIILN